MDDFTFTKLKSRLIDISNNLNIIYPLLELSKNERKIREEKWDDFKVSFYSIEEK